MMKERIKILTEVAENALTRIKELEKDETKSEAFITGYSQGTIKAIIDELKQIQELP